MYAIGQYSKSPIFQINDHIGFDDDSVAEDGTIEKGDGQGIDGKIFAKEFFETDALNPDVITVYVNTMGGDVKQSLDMFNAMSRVRTRTKGIISGFAYSCGGWLPLACDTVEMVEHGSWMCHMPYNPKDENSKSSFLDAALNTIATIISSKSGKNGKPKKTVDEIKKMMKTKTYLNAVEMYNAGFIDYITDADGNRIDLPQEETVAYNIDTDYKTIRFQYKEKKVALNKFFEDKVIKNLTTEKNTDMKKIFNRLNNVKAMNFNLVEDSSEQDVLNSIATMENKINNLASEKDELEKASNRLRDEYKALNEAKSEMEGRMKQLQSKNEDIDSEISNMKESMSCMEAENKSLKAEKEVADNKAKESAKSEATAKAEVLIDGYIATGKITASNEEDLKEVRSGWIEDAVVNYSKTKRQLDAMPVAMALPKPFFPKGDDNRPDAGSGSIKDFQALNRAERDAKRDAYAKREAAIFNMAQHS